MNDNYVVYMHTSPNNKKYIGITSQKPERRWRKNGEGYKNHQYFWKAIKKYGWSNFVHEILYSNLTKKEAEQKEVELIAHYNSNDADYGYNLSAGGESGSKGYKYTDKQREHMKIVNGGENNPMYGKHHTEIAKQKNRTAHLRENLSEETIHKMSIAKKGKKRDKKAIEKQINSISNKVICIETKVIYKNTKVAGIVNNLDSSCISKVCRGERKTCGGYRWSYLKNLDKNDRILIDSITYKMQPVDLINEQEVV